MADTHLTGVRIDSSLPAIAQVRGNSIISEDAKVSLPLWLSEILEEYKESENNRTEEANIPKVPEPNIPNVPDKLKEKKTKCYRPLAVSIGPYHYIDRQRKCKQLEKLKVRMMVKFVKDKERKDLYVNVKEELQKARGCYNDSITEKFSDEEFIKMMFIDGCFILQFMHCLNAESEKLEMSDRQIFHVKRDLLLLENQLPFAVMDSLRRQRYKNLSESNEIINNFLSLHIRSSGKPIKKWVPIALTALGLVMIPISFPLFLLYFIISVCIFFCLSHRKLRKCFVSFRHSKNVSLDWSPPPGKTQPDHLLQLLYYKSMYHYSKRNHKKAQPGSRGHGLYYSAKNLKKEGILFRPRWSARAITDVKFKSSFLSGKVEVPPIIIDESTESLLLNLVAYESAAALDQLWVSSYILFMDSLIDDAEDVKEMRSNGIIINYLGADQKVAKLFNGMGESLTYDTAAYNDVKMDINKQCESTVKRWAYEWKTTYFSNPWTFITLLAASFGLCLTATQTYYTRFPPK
ncbi:hypothetical protein DKX38_023665 [Salix brachista]|uniref:Uncharacterized protein n=1 Tax=Salix brachista TaxID=2182728 RepID=A0A5N5JLD5_9ROSI|nr:hypothetical protein DKX38_023665 [Salix brachista]